VTPERGCMEGDGVGDQAQRGVNPGDINSGGWSRTDTGHQCQWGEWSCWITRGGEDMTSGVVNP